MFLGSRGVGRLQGFEHCRRFERIPEILAYGAEFRIAPKLATDLFGFVGQALNQHLQGIHGFASRRAGPLKRRGQLRTRAGSAPVRQPT